MSCIVKDKLCQMVIYLYSCLGRLTQDSLVWYNVCKEVEDDTVKQQANIRSNKLKSWEA